MGRTTTPKYAVHVRTSDGSHMTPIAWRVRAQYGIPGDGMPTEANLAKWATGYNKSFEPGGVNEGVGCRIVYAEIRRNVFAGEVVARWSEALS